MKELNHPTDEHRLSIVVPVYNEKNWLTSFWSRLMKAPLDKCNGIKEVELIVVDDGSTDGSDQLIRSLTQQTRQFDCGTPVTCRFIGLPDNRGKGFAIRRGIVSSTGEIVLIQDADMEYSPSDYPVLVRPIVDGFADAVFGSRFRGDCRRVLYFWHSLVNFGLTTLSNAINDLNLTDMETGYKVFRGELIRNLKLTSDRFGIEPEITSRLARAGARIYEVPVSYQGRSYDEGKKIGVKDGIAAFFHILKFGFWDRASYLPGLWQSLTALDKHASVIYGDLIARSISPTDKPIRIMEIGAGIGSLTKELAKYGEVVATDISTEMVRHMKDRFRNYQNVTVRAWDATQPVIEGAAEFDYVFAFNILEHIEDDRSALNGWKKLLKPKGKLVVLVPNYPKLFAPMDKEFGHFRRYQREDLVEKCASSGMNVERLECGNVLGILGWWFNAVLLKRRYLPEGQLGLYRLIKPFIAPVEKFFRSREGLNLIIEATPSKS